MRQTTDTCMSFCRLLYHETMKDVRAVIPKEEVKQGWAWRDGRRHVEFHGPNKFYWSGRGCCLADAKTRGWQAYLFHLGIGGES